MGRPRPVPLGRVVTKGRKMRSRSSPRMPTPVSSKRIAAMPAASPFAPYRQRSPFRHGLAPRSSRDCGSPDRVESSRHGGRGRSPAAIPSAIEPDALPKTLPEDSADVCRKALRAIGRGSIGVGRAKSSISLVSLLRPSTSAMIMSGHSKLEEKGGRGEEGFSSPFSPFLLFFSSSFPCVSFPCVGPFSISLRMIWAAPLMGRQGVAHFMRHFSGQLPDVGQAAHLFQFGLQARFQRNVFKDNHDACAVAASLTAPFQAVIGQARKPSGTPSWRAAPQGAA